MCHDDVYVGHESKSPVQYKNLMTSAEIGSREQTSHDDRDRWMYSRLIHDDDDDI